MHGYFRRACESDGWHQKVTRLINEANSNYGTLIFVSKGPLSDEEFGAIGEPSTFGRLQADRVVVCAGSVNFHNADIDSFNGRASGSISIKNNSDLTIGDLSASSIFIDVIGTVTITPGATLDVSKFPVSPRPSSTPDPPAMPQGRIPFARPQRRQRRDPRHVRGSAGRNANRDRRRSPGAHHLSGQQARWNERRGHRTVCRTFAGGMTTTRCRRMTTATGYLPANDISYGNGPLRVTAVNGVDGATGRTITLPSGASLWVDPDGYFYYTPGRAFPDLAADEERTDRFRYEATDAYGGSWVAEVWITVIGEGTEDLIGFNGGGWYVGVAKDGSFTTSAWAGWSDAEWDALRQGDFNGDGRTDVLGLLDGMWFVGISTGTSFTTTLRTAMVDVEWQDVLIADLDRDGNDDILARGGNWWASLSEWHDVRCCDAVGELG